MVAIGKLFAMQSEGEGDRVREGGAEDVEDPGCAAGSGRVAEEVVT